MALSTSRTLITKTGISTTQIFDMGGINIAGGDFNLGSSIKLGNASGIITATSFSGSFGGGAFTGDLSIDDKIVHTGDTDTAIRFPIADRITAEVAGSEKVRISSIGVGINTDSSLYNTGNSHLVVRGNNITSNSDAAVAVLHSGTAGIGQIRFTDGASGYHASQSWVQFDHSANRFTIGWNAQGRVHGGPNNEFGLFYDTPSNLDSNAHELVIGGGTGSGGMTLFNSTSGQGNIFFADGIGSAADKKRGQIIYDHSDNSMQFATDNGEKLRIESTGDIIFKNNGGDNRIERNTTSGGPYLLFHNRGTNTTDSSGVYNMGGISAAGYRDVANPGIVGSIQFERQPTAGGASSGCDIVFRTGFNGTTSHTGMSEKLRLTYAGHLLPGANNQYDLGSTAKGWRNVYMNDLNLSNMKGDTNDVDGTQGSWTIQEGKDNLYIINRLNGKKFKIKMEEIS